MNIDIRFAVLILAAGISACSKPLPPLANNLPGQVAEAERIFNVRVKVRYPLGKPQSEMIRDVAAQGFGEAVFTPDVPTGWWSADFNSGDMVCNKVASVRWRTDAAKKLAEVWGVYGVQCP